MKRGLAERCGARSRSLTTFQGQDEFSLSFARALARLKRCVGGEGAGIESGAGDPAHDCRFVEEIADAQMTSRPDET